MVAKTIAYYPLHYGMEYLDVSLKSIENVVDKIIVLYSPKPTFGYESELICPEPEWALRAIVGQRAEWVSINSSTEAEHRDIIYQYAEGYDLVLAMDADEVWEEEALRRCLAHAYNGKAWRYNILDFVHFWRSFNYACHDRFAPGRIYNLHNRDHSEESISGLVYHFGYAQSEEIIRYKMAVHGHKSEIRKEWLDLFLNWTPGIGDLHPAAYGVWPEATPFDKNLLPDILKAHPNFNKEKI